MPPKKATDPEDILSNTIIVRVTEATFKRLKKMHQESDTHSIAEIVRKIIDSKKINLFYKDMTLNAAMEELALIRKELKAIGININQLTRGYNQNRAGAQRPWYVIKVSDLYKKVDEKTDRLLIIISQLAEKWLAK